MKPSDTVQRKFIETRCIDDYEILTDSGWVDAKRIHKTEPYQIYILKTLSHTLKCADTHIVFRDDMSETFVKYLVPGDKIMTNTG